MNEFNVGEYSIFELSVSSGNNAKKNILITAGIHGDEPAGVETIFSFLEQKLYEPFLGKWKFSFIPCLNPYGFEKNSRNGRNNEDLNRLFKAFSPPPEVIVAQKILKSQSWSLAIELHEDCDSDGYYLFIKGQLNSLLSLGEKILNAVRHVIPINFSEEIEGIPADAGIIHKIPNINEMQWWPMSGYSAIQDVDCILTLETPISYPMEVRVEAHTKAILSALNQFSNFC